MTDNDQPEQRRAAPPSRITIVDLARMAGVNPSTVSRALSGSSSVREDTRSRIVELAKKTGYVANHGARMMRSRRAAQILVVVPNIAASFYPQVILGVEEALADQDCGVIIGSTRNQPEREAALGQQLLNGSADGLLLLGGRISSDLLDIPHYRQRIIAISRRVANSGIACVTIDNRAAAAEATRHLLSLGHRDILHFAGPSRSPVFTDRVEGFRAAMHDAGLAAHGRVIEVQSFDIAAGRQAMRDLLATGQLPQAILCASDELAFGAMQIARQAGLHLPDDLAFVGFDDHPVGEAFEPALTTIALPRREMGQLGATMLLAGIRDGHQMPMDRILPYRLVVRHSCGAVPVGA